MEHEIGLLLSKAAGYILKGAAQSKAADNAKEQVLSKFWNWIKPKFLKKVPEIEDKPEALETEINTQEYLLELVKDEAFFKELVQQMAALQQAGITEKNIVKKNIEQVKKVRIGDTEYSPTESYNRKNIVEGNVKNVDEFILGDGH